MEKTRISTESFLVYKPVYMSGASSDMLGIYDPLCSRIYIPTNAHKSLTDEFEFSNYVVDINQTLDKADIYVKLTEGCNFACPGCVTASDRIKPENARHMKIDVLQFMLERIFESAQEKGFSQIKIKWAGGEPLLHVPYKTITQIQETIKSLSKKYYIEVQQVILTNGVFITEEKLDFIKKHKIQLSISLWGTRSIQDLLRKPRNKQESFDIVAKNICNVHINNIDYSVNHVVTPLNSKHFKSFIELMWDTTSKRFIGRNHGITTPIPIYFAMFRPQTHVSRDVLSKNYDIIRAGLTEGFAYIYELIKKGIPIQPLARFDYLNLTGISLTTCGTGYSYLAIGPDGITNCHENLYEMKNNLDKLNNVNIFDLAAQEFDNIEQDLVGINNSNNTLLALHGGLGCPRQRLKLKNSAAIEKFYMSILNDLLALEICRNNKELRL